MSRTTESFKSAWEQGERPALEAWLSGTQGKARMAVFRMLLQIELVQRRNLGETPQPSDYRNRFPEASAQIASVFAESGQPPSTDDVATLLPVESTADADAATLLPASGKQDSVSEEATLIPTDVSDGAASVGDRVRYFGDYELLDEIARGGMGVVFKARQVRLNRLVALKMILSGELAGEEEVKRFQTEAEAAATLDHPGIVPIYEIGEHGGQHFFSMGFVEGESLADRVKDGPLPSREAASLLKKITEAIAYAHDNGVIHRDLKPANVLLDAGSEPRVTDFGIAKKLEADSQLTGTGQILGTPAYMPPEQASGDIQGIDRRADVYALGAILYCLVTGRPPFQAPTPLGTVMQVLEREPVSPRELNPELDADLETICLKCLSKEKHRRYASAESLAEELQRFLRGEPILARPVAAPERLWRWCKRNPVVALLTTAFLTALVLGTVISAYFAIQSGRKAKENRIIADQETAARRDAQHQLRVATARRLVSDSAAVRDQWPQRSALLAVDALERAEAADELTAMSARQNLNESLQAIGGIPLADVSYANFSPDSRWACLTLADGTVQLLDCSRDDPLRNPRTLRNAAHTGPASTMAFSVDARWLAVGYDDGPVGMWDLSKGGDNAVRSLKGNGVAGTLSFDRSGRYLSNQSFNRPYDPSLDTPRFRTVSLCDLQQPSMPILDYRSERFLAISSNGRWLLTAGANEESTELFLRDLTVPDSEPQLLNEAAEFGRVSRALLNSDGQLLVLLGPSTTHVLRLDGSTVKAHTVLHESEFPLSEPLLTPNSRWLIAEESRDDLYQLWLWDLTADDPAAGRRELVRSARPIGTPQLLSDATILAIGTLSRAVTLWDMTAEDPSRTERRIPTMHRHAIMDLKASKDGRWLMTAGNKTIRRYDLSAEIPSLNVDVYRGHEASCFMEVSPDGRWMFSFDDSGSTRFWDLTSAESSDLCTVLRGHQEPIWTPPAVQKRGDLVATTSSEGDTRIWRFDSGDARPASQKVSDHTSPAGVVSLAADGQFLVAAGQNHTAEIWRIDAGDQLQLVETLTGHTESITDAAFSPDGRLLLTTSWDNSARVWRIAEDGSPSLVKVLSGNTAITLVRFSADGRWMLTGGDSFVGSVWKIQAGQFVGRPKPVFHDRLYSDDGIRDAAFSPDGNRLFTASSDHTIRIWDLTAELFSDDRTVDSLDRSFEEQVRIDMDRQSPVILRDHESPVTSLAVSDDGHWLASGSWDNTARLWDLTSEDVSESAMTLKGHDDWVWDVEFSPDGDWLATAGLDGVIRLWNTKLPSPMAASIALKGHTAGVRGVRFSSDGHWLYSVSEDTTVRRWNTRWDELKQKAIARSGRPLTNDEKTTYGLPPEAE